MEVPFKGLRADGIKAMSRGFSGGNKQSNLPIQEIAVEFVYCRQQKIKNYNGNRPFLIFSTFDMDKLGKICRHHGKKRLKISMMA